LSLLGFILTAGVSVSALAQTSPDANGLSNSVVKVFAISRLPDPFKPWAKQGPRTGTGSGVVIEGNRILTNAHVVSYASQVEIQASGSGDKLMATVEAIAPGIDLAVLKLEDESFFKTHAPLARASSLPEIKDAVLAYGFPTGGSSLSITKGIVSRIEFANYNMGVSGLRIQIDAAINAGNSGGPAIAGDKMIGLAYSRLNDAQNIGYIIPNEEIELFLKDIADGSYDGKYFVQDELQTFENPALRRFLKLDASVRGLIVKKPFLEDAAYPLKKWDVVTHIGPFPIDSQGQVKVGADLRLGANYMIQKLVQTAKNPNTATIPLSIVRDGKTSNIALPVVNKVPQLIPDLDGGYPSYFVYGPLVFSKATTSFLSFLGSNANSMGYYVNRRSPLITSRGVLPTPEREELVVISSPYFPHRLAIGYGNPSGDVVLSVNGVNIRSLKHLVRVLRDNTDEFVRIETDNKDGETLVFPHKDMLAAMESILTDNSVRSQGTSELMDIWTKKVAD
jgi:S1-C subfamily serine protease